jgi:hypothetical protein
MNAYISHTLPALDRNSAFMCRGLPKPKKLSLSLFASDPTNESLAA